MLAKRVVDILCGGVELCTDMVIDLFKQVQPTCALQGLEEVADRHAAVHPHAQLLHPVPTTLGLGDDSADPGLDIVRIQK